MAFDTVHEPRGLWLASSPAAADLLSGLARRLGGVHADPAGWLGRLFELEPEAWLRRIPGRETFTPGAGVVVKRFRRDPWREWWRDLARGGPLRSPARREAENLTGLLAAGIPVPTPLAWLEEPRARAAPFPGHGRSVLVMELLPHEQHLRRRLQGCDAREVREWTATLAALVARLHGAGWFHRDLYLQHFAVLDAAGRRLALLDCGRARRVEPVPRRWIVKDLAQLLHSSPATVGARARLRWLVLYARARGIAGAGPRRALVRAVLAKELRMRAHAPRHLDPRTAHPDGSER